MSRWLQRLRRDDGGFGLIEAVVALLIAGVVFGALATSLVAAVQASLYSRQNQQATDFMTRELEKARALDFGALAHPTAPAAVSPLISCGAGICLPVELLEEPLVVETGGAIAATQTLLGAETNNTEYTVRTFVTQALGQPVENVRRVTVEISWLNRGIERTRTTSTLIAFAQRGLPLPVFRIDVASQTPLTLNPGGTFVFELTLTNQGAPDVFDLTHDGGAGWAFFLDSDDDGVYDPAVDTTAVTDTGRLDPASTITLFLVRTTSATDPDGTQTVVTTATSRGQPLATGGVKTAEVVATLQSGVIAPPPPPPPGPYTPLPECAATAPALPTGGGSYSVLAYTLQHNGVGPDSLQEQMYMGTGAGDEPVLAPYSTDLDAAALGRILRPTGAATDAAILALTDRTQYADWAIQYDKKRDVQGQPVLRLWVQRHSGTGPVALEAVLFGASSSGTGLSRTAWGSAPADLGTLTCSVAAAPGWQEVWVTLPDVGTRSIPKNGWMGVRVVATHASTDEVRLAYDVPAQFAASLTVRVK